jgi:Na+/H+ antiporter NhaD/arsenite permease-like protein
MPSESFPTWAILPFPALILAIAVLPTAAPRVWERRWVQAVVMAVCALPIVGLFVAMSRTRALVEATTSYLSFVSTLGALYVTSGGVHVSGDIEPKPSTNVALVTLGAVLASLVGTTGAGMLMIRLFLRVNRRRQHRKHLVPFFILAVANAGGMLTPLGDPPLLVGYIGGVPFFWTLRLFPAWLLYIGTFAAALYVVDRRAYAREARATIDGERAEVVPIQVTGRRNVALMLAVVPAALLPLGYREVAMAVIAAASIAMTPRTVHEANHFTYAPIVEVAFVFAGVFVCLGPIEALLAAKAPLLPLHKAWQLFWAAGIASSFLDNAPTYAAFSALARGLSAGAGLVAGIAPYKLAALSIGSVAMGATTYIGNGPNLMIKAMAERQGFRMPTFAGYAIFAFIAMVPAHIVTTAVLLVLER